MNRTPKEEIIRMRREGLSYNKISVTLSVPEGTVKSFCLRNNLGGMAAPVFDSPNHCRYCGKKLKESPQSKVKRFCSDRCRMSWWKSHPEKLNRHAVQKCYCSFCGTEFVSYSSAQRKFCSRACYGKSKVIRHE